MESVDGRPDRESFWDAAYRRGDHRDHWESLDPESELGTLPEERLCAGATALDIGCGAGVEAVWLARRGLRVIGVDSSRRALELATGRARRAGLAIDWRAGSALALPVADRSVDLAIDRGCLHVVARRRRRLYAKEAARVVRPGGALAVWAARHDDDDLGLVGLGRREADRLFGPRGFERAAGEGVTLRSRAGELAAVRYLFVKRPA